MELQICKGLEWQMRTLTPFRFVEFFIPILNLPPNPSSPRPLVRDLIIRSQYASDWKGLFDDVIGRGDGKDTGCTALPLGANCTAVTWREIG